MASLDLLNPQPTNEAPVQKSDDAAGFYTLGDKLVDAKAPTGRSRPAGRTASSTTAW